MKLSTISLQFIHDVDITNNIESMNKLKFKMRNETLFRKTKARFALFSILAIFSYTDFLFIANSDIEKTIFTWSFYIFLTLSLSQILLGFLQIMRIRTIDSEFIHNYHLLTMIKKYHSDMPVIFTDLQVNQLMDDKIVQDMTDKYYQDNLDTFDIEKIYQVLLTEKLKSTPLPSTTISLDEHKKEIKVNHE